MDVTITPGAPRAGEAAIRPRQTGRAAGPDFEAFLRPAVERPAAGEGSRADRPDAIDRRDDITERDAARRHDERRAAERRAAERREADAAEAREPPPSAATPRRPRPARASERRDAERARRERTARGRRRRARARRRRPRPATPLPTPPRAPMTPTRRPTTRRTPMTRAADGITPRPRRRAVDDTLPAGALGLTWPHQSAPPPTPASPAPASPPPPPARSTRARARCHRRCHHRRHRRCHRRRHGRCHRRCHHRRRRRPRHRPDGAPLDLALLDRADPSEALARALGPRRLAPDTVRLGPRLPGDPADPAPPRPRCSPPPARPADAAPVARAPLGRAALPPGVDESAVLRQVSDALRAGDRSRTAEIALHPAELGRVRLRITMHDGVARVVVGAEQPAVVDLLASGLDELRRDLMAHGLQVGHLEVEAQLSRDPHGRHEAHERDDAEAPERPAPKASTPRRMARGLIDIEA
ncbi:MAG: flagellar hook-length control protein FliK [Myxococcales bacterium]|nr:flagellar hook-length control protein FliK [Myxococcales bacterium]